MFDFSHVSRYRQPLLWLLSLLCCASSYAQPNIKRVEYFFDTDPGYGQGTSVPFTPSADLSNLSFSPSISGLSSGFHKLLVRAKDTNGQWSLTSERTFYKEMLPASSTALANIRRLEYFIDTDPGIGSATAAAIPTGTDLNNIALSININALSTGFHKLAFRTKDASGRWSLTSERTFYKETAPASVTPLANISRVEYFVDTDPGYGLGTAATISAGSNNLTNIAISLNTTSLSSGFHKLAIRSKDALGRWSLTSERVFYKEVPAATTVLSNIKRLEYFIDSDPGSGLGTAVAFTASANLSNVLIPVNITALSSGFHKLAVRAKDATGKWSLTSEQVFYKEQLPATTQLQNITRVEYFIDSDPGMGNGTAAVITAGSNLSNVAMAINTSSLSTGFHKLGVRTRDASGKWSLTSERVFYKEQVPVSTALANITRLEYFFDTDPGFGNGLAAAITAGNDLNNVDVAVDISALGTGFHRLAFRTKDATGKWSLTSERTFYKDAIPAENFPLPAITRIEYFVDTDPGFGSGTVVPFSPGTDLSYVQVMINTTGLASGSHTAFVRAKDARGSWSLVSKSAFTIFTPAALGGISTLALSQSAYCPGSQVLVSFHTGPGVALAGNVFTAQLSDATGSFTAPVNIGTLTAQSSGTINATIPLNVALGSGYRIRVIASSPGITGTDNGTNLNILALPAQPLASTIMRCGPGTVILSVTNATAGLNYRWYNTASSGTLLATGTSFTTPVLASTGTYYVEATNGNCTTGRTAVQAVINPIPAVPSAAALPATIVQGGNTTLSISNPVAGYTYAWSGANLSAATGSSVTAAPATVGTYSYTVRAITAQGCSSAVKTLVVQVNATSIYTSAINPAQYCAGASVSVAYTLNSTFNTGNVFTAQLSDAYGSFVAPVPIGTRTGTTAGTITAKIPATAVGTGYRIRVVASAPAATGSDNGSNLTVLAAPTAITTTSVYYCNGQTGPGTLSVSGGGASVTGYNWYTTATGGTPFFSGTTYTTPVLTSSQAYYVAAVNSNGCESNPRKAAAVYITPSFTVSAAAVTPSFELGGSTSITATATTPGVTFKWSPATGLSATAGATVTASPAATTTYTITGTRNTCTYVTTVTVTVTCPGPLSGTYTINKTAPASATNFPSVKAFADRISLCGVAGPVTVNMVTGTGPYTEQVEFGQISGVSAVNTVTLNGNGNVLQFSPASTANYLLRLNGTDYFQLHNLTLTSTSATYGWGIHLFNGADNNIISDCIFNLSTTANGPTSNGIVASNSVSAANTAGTTVSNLQVLNNQINGGYYGLSICGDAAAKASGILISGNTISSTYFAGAYLFNLNAVKFNGNTVSMRTGNVNNYGVFLNTVDNGFTIKQNKVASFGRYGVYLTNCNSTAVTTRAEISNNMIGGEVKNTAAATYGLYLNNADRIDLWHNSVNLDQGFTNSAACYVLASSIGMDVRNNSFAFSGTSASYAFYAPTASLTTLDYNNYYSTGTKFVNLGGDKADLTALKAAAVPAGHDAHSYQGNPGYVSANDLHVQAAFTQLSNRGTLLAVSADIDGNSRSTTPDIGADEYAVATRMAGNVVLFSAEVYPNPFSAELTVKVVSPSEEPVQILITDALGRTAAQRTMAAGEWQLATDQLKPGLYLISVQQGEQSRYIKVIKSQ